VSDRVDVALAVDADGVHLGGGGLPVSVVRRIVPERWLIGASVGAMDEVPCAAGADFVAIGPVFSSSSATLHDDRVAMGIERFTELARACALPAVAVGGVSPATAAELVRAGATGVAVISPLFGAADPMRAARALRDVLDASGR